MPPRRAKANPAPTPVPEPATPSPAGSGAATPGGRLHDPRGAAQALRQRLEQQAAALLACDRLDRGATEDLVKLGALIEKLEGCGYDLRAAAVEVGERLVDFVAGREADAARKIWLADTLAAFFLSLDSGARP
ncbi:MAG: hypothetical protein V1797_03895 [Pseudomonadota bacterium]